MKTGAMLSPKNGQGKIPIMVAKSEKIIEYLKSKGAAT
jgi:hypothetical protein